jgi:hypothetical protein
MQIDDQIIAPGCACLGKDLPVDRHDIDSDLALPAVF